MIRMMTAQDAPAVLEMMRVFYASPAVLSNGSEEIFQNDVAECVSGSPYLEGYVFEENGQLQGYAMVAKSFSTEFGKRCIWIEDLYTNFNLQIENERTSQLPLYPPQRRDKTRPTGDLPSLPVEALANYTIVFNDSPTSLQIQNYKDHIVLEYIKDSWQVVSIKQDVQIETVEIAQVEEAFTQLLQESGENLASATEKLVQQYPWIQ